MESISSYHILNGDALLDMFPDNIKGEKIVFRECLMDGPVTASENQSFYEVREKFLTNTFGIGPSYQEVVIPELEKISTIPSFAPIHLWFEDDLFCQVNLWYVIHKLENHNADVFLIHPPRHTPYGFGGLSKDELVTCFHDKLILVDLTPFMELWMLYQAGYHEDILIRISKLGDTFSFIRDAAQANIERFPKENELSRPIKALIEIIKELGPDNFVAVFQEFCKREAIYGYGDLQVKLMYDEIKRKSFVS